MATFTDHDPELHRRSEAGPNTEGKTNGHAPEAGPKLPEALKASPHWLVAKVFPDPERPDKLKKFPISLKTGNSDGWNKLENLVSFEEAAAYCRTHPGFVLGFAFWHSPFMGLDFDDAFDDKGPKAEVLQALEPYRNAYMERSPSGKGLRLILRKTGPIDSLPEHSEKQPLGNGASVEVFPGGFCTITGNHVIGDAIPLADPKEVWHRYVTTNRQRPRTAVIPIDEAGGRNNTLISYAGTLLSKGLSVDEVKALVRAKNQTFSEPLPERELRATIDKSTERYAQPEDDLEDQILVSEPLHRAVEKAERLLSPLIYARGENLVRVVKEDKQYKNTDAFRRPEGNSYLALLGPLGVECLLSQLQCVWRIERKNKVSADPPGKWSKAMLERAKSFPDQTPWRRLNLITNVPLLLKDGSLVNTPGYHQETGVYFDPRGIEFPPIPDRPTKEQAKAALDQFEYVFGKFPFGGEPWNQTPSYACVLATIVSVVVRHLVRPPMLAVDAPDVGSGKTLLSEAVTMAATGCLPACISYDNLQEFEKTLVTPLLAGDPVIFIDNIEGHALRSPRLCTALTADGLISWRVLGVRDHLKILNRSVFIATGNQLRVEGELPRRTIRCRLIPNCPFPEARKFDFNPVDHARERFPELVMGTLCAIRWFLQAGCPTPKYADGAPLESGKFEAWNRIVRGMLLNLGFADVMRTQREVRLENPMFQQDTYLVLALYEDFKNEKFSAGRIIKDGSASKELLTDGEGKLLSNSDIGYRLRDLKDRVLAGMKVVRLDKYGHVNNYQIVGTPKEEDKDDFLF